MLPAVVAFTAVAALLTIAPGADVALVLRTALTGGRAVAVAAAAGIATGCACWGLASALGVTALLAASRLGYDGLRLAGAGYLCWLGWQALRGHRGHRPDDGTDPGAADRSARATGGSRRRAFRAGLVTNLLNPKVGVFYVSVLPNFVPPGRPVLPVTLLLVAVHVVLGLAWLSMLAAAVDRARGVLARRRVRRRLEQATGVVLVGFGIGVALDTTR